MSLNPPPADGAAGPGCGACRRSLGRRSFLERVGLAALAAWLTLGGDPEILLAEMVRPAKGRQVSAASVAYPIPEADGVAIDKANQVILVRWQGSAYAFNLSCPHQNTALRWESDAGRFQCPKHHSKYRPDGVFISGRATRGMDRLAISRSGDQLVVNVDTLYQEDANPSEWKAATVVL